MLDMNQQDPTVKIGLIKKTLSKDELLILYIWELYLL